MATLDHPIATLGSRRQYKIRTSTAQARLELSVPKNPFRWSLHTKYFELPLRLANYQI